MDLRREELSADYWSVHAIPHDWAFEGPFHHRTFEGVPHHQWEVGAEPWRHFSCSIAVVQRGSKTAYLDQLRLQSLQYGRCGFPARSQSLGYPLKLGKEVFRRLVNRPNSIIEG